MSDVVYLTPDELVDRYKGKVNKRTLANWRSNGDGPEYVKIGGRVLYPYGGVLAWEERRTRRVYARDDRRSAR